MTKLGITIRLLAAAGAVAGGWFTAPYWQAQPSLRSAVRLLFRPAAGIGGGTLSRSLTLNGFTFSLTDLDNPGSFRALLGQIQEAAWDAPPHDAEKFLISLMDQLAGLSPGELRSLALSLARDRNLLAQLDQTTRALSTRLLSRDLELHLATSLAAVIQRDPDRMLLLAEALPPSRTRDEFLGRTLGILAVERPEAVLALLDAPDSPLKDRELGIAGASAIQTLAARSVTELAEAMKGMTDSRLKGMASHALIDRVNDQPDEVFVWLDGLPDETRGGTAAAALSYADPETASRWLAAHPSPAGNEAAFVAACGRLAKSDPAAAAKRLKDLPTLEASRVLTFWSIPSAMAAFPIKELLTITPGLTPENQALLLPGAFSETKRSVGELTEMAALITNPDLKQKLAAGWSESRKGDPAEGVKEAESLPPGPLRDTAMGTLSSLWSRHSPETWLEWMRGASSADQTAAMAKVNPTIWSDPKNAAFLTIRPASEQLPWLASIYHDNAQAAAAVIEQASTQGANAASLDAAAKSLAESWQDRDPATARAFAQSLPDPAMADSVLAGMAASSSTSEARAAATAAIQNPIVRQQAERAAALRDAGITQPPLPSRRRQHKLR